MHIFQVFVRVRIQNNYLTKVLYRLTFVGSIFLAAIAILPVIFTKLGNLPPSAQIGGTSILIVVGVALETMKQLESQLVKRHYKGFMKQCSKWEELSSLHAHVLRGNNDEIDFNGASWCW